MTSSIISQVSRLGTVEFTGSVHNDKNISALDRIGEFLILGADEANQVQVLQRHGDDYGVIRNIILNQKAEEIDIEGIACEGDSVYVVGSHSWKRKKMDPEKSYEENRKLMLSAGSVIPQPDRDRLCHFSLAADGSASPVEETSLRSIIDNSLLLQVFSRVPSKENGVDIEGISVRDGQLYIGFRGPVLRENWVPVLKCRFAQPITETELVFVNMGGLGFRDITRVDKGFLLLAGPVGDGPGLYQVYFWDGEDCLPGIRPLGKYGQIKCLGEIPTHEEGKAEGLSLLKEGHSHYEVLIVFDGLKNGAPTRFRITKA
jgi:Protein of unknown function (DUF3616)